MLQRYTLRIWLLVSLAFLVLLAPLVYVYHNGEDGRVDFYGHIVDQFEHSVEDVDIRVHLAKFGFYITESWRMTEFHIKSDAKGSFKITGERGQRLSFYDFKKTGYEFLGQNASFNNEQNTNDIFHPDPKNPVIFRMRRKEEEACLVDHGYGSSSFEFQRIESGTQKACDLIFGEDIEEKDFGNPKVGHIPLVPDFKTKADYDPKTKKWGMRISPGDPEGGIIVSRVKLYAAPEDGYLPSYTIDPGMFNKEFNLEPVNQPGIPSYVCAYVYLKSRTPPIYSRFSIANVRANEREIHVDAGGYITNPYGERNLEQAKDVPGEIKIKLRQEIHECYSQGRRPPKPDLSWLIREEEEKQIPWYKQLVHKRNN